MDIYADSLKASLSSSEISTTEFLPESTLESFSENPWVMRYLRYIDYPAKVKKLVNDKVGVHHVIDHGYAHIARNIDCGVKVLTVHDLIPYLAWKKAAIFEANPSNSKRKPYLNLWSFRYLSLFDHIISVSQSTAEDLVTYFGVDERLISVIPPAISPHFGPVSKSRIDAFRQEYSLDVETKWIMVSGREFYKNHKTSLKVFKRLLEISDTPIGLIKTGLPSEEFDCWVAEFELDAYVKQFFLDGPEDLATMYCVVDCLLFPSLYEGFGMPVAEALGCGTPVVISDRASLPEVAGLLAEPVDAFDVDALCQEVMKSLHDPRLIEKVKSSGPSYVKKYDPDVLGLQYQTLYHGLLSSHQSGLSNK